jgi:hypothetical protein
MDPALMSVECSKCYSKAFDVKEKDNKENFEKARKIYLALIDKPNSKELMNLIVQNINIDVTKNQKPTSKPESITVCVNDIVKLQISKSGNYFVGRKSYCDIKFPQCEDDISRIQNIIKVTDDGFIIIIDLGNANGTLTLERSSDNKLENSTPDNRKNLIFTMDEKIKISINNKTELTIAPTEMYEKQLFNQTTTEEDDNENRVDPEILNILKRIEKLGKEW